MVCEDISCEVEYCNRESPSLESATSRSDSRPLRVIAVPGSWGTLGYV